jgi:hypothetical protein
MSPSTAAKARSAQRVKRQKQFIAVGSVVLLALLGFEMTKFLGHGSSHSAARTTTAASSVAGSPAPSAPAASLPDTDRLVVQRNTNQLLSFGLFGSKDPFVQQLTQPPPSATPTPAPTTPTTPSTPAASPETPTSTTPTTPSQEPAAPETPTTETQLPAGAPGATTPSSPTEPAGPVDSVLISTNRVCQQLAVNGTFPEGEDIFRVVSIAKDGKSVDIGVVGGSYDSGQATATLKLGQTLTLVNTADGTRYAIELKSKCAVVVPSTPTVGATTTVTTPPAPTPTQPIVPDSLDTTTTTTTTTTTPTTTTPTTTTTSG